MTGETQDLPTELLWIISPTRAFFDLLKKKECAVEIVNWTWIFSGLNVALFLVLPSPWNASNLIFRCLIWAVVWAIPSSRLIEILYAFYNDSVDQLSGKKPRSGLDRVDRLKLVGRSYLEGAICYALLFQMLPADSFIRSSSQNLKRLDWLYFSWVTITTTGYGDIFPSRSIAKLLCMSEIGFGLILIVFSVGTYFSYKESRETD